MGVDLTAGHFLRKGLPTGRLAAGWLIAWAVCASGCRTARPPEIYVHFPQSAEDLQVPAVRSTFVLGNVQPAESTLVINGKPARVRPNGAFLEYVSLTPGDLVIRLQATNRAGSSAVDLPLHVAAAPAPERGRLIEPGSLEPAEDLELIEGDRLFVRVRGASLLTGSFEIEGLRSGLPLLETSPGHYEGEYRIQARDQARNRPVRITLGDPQQHVRVTTGGRVTILGAQRTRVAVLEREREGLNYVGRGPDGPTFLRLPNGIRVLMAGRHGDKARVRLSSELDGWLPLRDLRVLPQGAEEPRAQIQTARVRPESRSSRLIVPLDQKVPYRVEHVGNRFTVVLSYAEAAGGRMQCRSEDRRVAEARCTASGGTVRIDLTLSEAQPLWGYHADYTAQGLELELRWPPVVDRRSPLSGVLVVLDPGHSPGDSGRVGPLGIPERTHNLRLARRLEPLLAAKGARVVMTRTRDDQEVSLQRRLDIAWAARGDLFVSLHCNSLGHGVDPYAAPRGFSVFYGQPYSIGLAAGIHGAYRRVVPLTDEGVRVGDLFVTMAPEMPSVVVESAYFILPEQEQLLLEESFQNQLARALLEGIQNALQATLSNPAVETVSRETNARAGRGL